MPGFGGMGNGPQGMPGPFGQQGPGMGMGGMMPTPSDPMGMGGMMPTPSGNPQFPGQGMGGGGNVMSNGAPVLIRGQGGREWPNGSSQPMMVSVGAAGGRGVARCCVRRGWNDGALTKLRRTEQTAGSACGAALALLPHCIYRTNAYAMIFVLTEPRRTLWHGQQANGNAER